MTEESKNKGGAPPGNQNARKHGYYSTILDDAGKADFERATEVEGIDEEIALLRVKIKALVQRDPDNIRLIMRAIDSMGKLARTKFNIGKNDKKSVAEAVAGILKDIAIPMGVGISSFMKKG